jgi:hypothetical protein
MIYRNLLLFLHFSLLPLPGSEKIDAAIDLNKRDFSPVFVRMSNQLVTCAGEYEKQIIVRSDKKRSKNRKEVIGLLQQKAKDSWEALSGTLRRLSKEGEVRNIRKFWVVNGFTCLVPCLCYQETGKSTGSFPDLSRPVRSTGSSVILYVLLHISGYA